MLQLVAKDGSRTTGSWAWRRMSAPTPMSTEPAMWVRLAKLREKSAWSGEGESPTDSQLASCCDEASCVMLTDATGRSR